MGGYRPKLNFVQKKHGSKVAYGSRSVWEDYGRQQNDRIKKAQFEENSKLCMCILKAVDQEQVDLKNNRELQSQLYLTEKS